MTRFEEVQGFDGEGRKSGECAEETYEQAIAPGHIDMFRQAYVKESHEDRSGDVHRERAIGESASEQDVYAHGHAVAQ